MNTTLIWFQSNSEVTKFPSELLFTIYEKALENQFSVTQWQINYPWHDPLAVNIFIMTVSSILCWILSILTHNYSQVDRIWSVIPFIYCWVFTMTGVTSLSELNPKLLLISVLTSIWGLRLTYNFARKGGYSMKEEDYRWPELRKIMNPLLFQLFNITFIAPYQNLLLLLITVPTYIVWLSKDVHTKISEFDLLITFLFLFFLMIETIADQQQWNFQAEKRRSPKGKDFLSSGLFRFSRHPNFFSEIMMWWCIYAFSLSSTNAQPLINWSIIGTLLLTLLFQGSTTFTEALSARKYPRYSEYQKTTSRLIPLPSTLPSNKKSQ